MQRPNLYREGNEVASCVSADIKAEHKVLSDLIYAGKLSLARLTRKLLFTISPTDTARHRVYLMYAQATLSFGQ